MMQEVDLSQPVMVSEPLLDKEIQSSEPEVTPYISPNILHKRIQNLAKEMLDDNRDADPYFLIAFKGAANFGLDLLKELYTISKKDFDYDFIKIQRAKKDDPEIISIALDDDKLKGRNVIVVEDMILSAKTLFYLRNYMVNRGIGTFKICTLFEQPEKKVFDVKINYTGFKLPVMEAVGYGLDHNERFRHLEFVGKYIGK